MVSIYRGSLRGCWYEPEEMRVNIISMKRPRSVEAVIDDSIDAYKDWLADMQNKVKAKPYGQDGVYEDDELLEDEHEEQGMFCCFNHLNYYN